ncbi:RNB domain-containing ribonuclease [Georgenia sp. EYE_87]|uniref:RNB domain-containing ribonuclease n=1 Tax=Georgenia sp. EYE_87 TaxID=2853448 RepID=UPI0020057A54|nr:RNB domain-containing ribonuclease [Georgenia sp. EYE_87]MCK6209688.1 RNB domain-containing ribonuclease [Georgenia sp. EYE_87]
MLSRYLALDTAAPDEVHVALERLRAELEIEPEFPPAALAEAQASVDTPLPQRDATGIPFVTIDPPGSRDLDQALHIERDGEGFLVRYAIASLATFVQPGGALDQEVHQRGVTVYGPTGSFPLHPPTLSAGAASLLPEEDRPACLWELRLDGSGELLETRVERAVVRSRAQLTYQQVQTAADGGPALPDGVPTDLPELLRTVGDLRQNLERQRGGVSLEIPEQHIERNEHGYVLAFRATLPVEGWNAQISLLTGIAAAGLMREAGVGILRTLPDPDPRDVRRLRRAGAALGVDWPEGTTYGELLRTLDSAVPAHAAFLNEATMLFRGAGYLALGVGGVADGDRPTTRHAAIAAEYAHVTAPLRRLVDRYGLEICLAHCAGEQVPAWVIDALPGLPSTMGRTTQRANAYERGAVDALEALVLEGRVGEVFEGVIVESDDGGKIGGTERGTVVVGSPAVEGRVEGADLPVGERIEVRLVEVDVPERLVRFELA